VDEAVQIHGGYGYISEYAVERHYRDSRIQRIFEGTNEINRILVPTMLLRRADGINLKGGIEAAQTACAGPAATAATGTFAAGAALLQNLKQLQLVVLSDTAQARESQEVLMAIADMIIFTFALESSLLRAEKTIAGASAKKKEQLRALVQVLAFDLSGKFQQAANRCVAYGAGRDREPALRRLIASRTNCAGAGLLEAKQLLADGSKEVGKYLF